MTHNATVIKGSAGSGKTTQMAEYIARHETGVVEVYQPTHRLGDEWKSSIQNYNPSKKVIAIKGREALDSQGQTLCVKHQLASQLSQKGLSVYPNLCRSSQGKGKPPLECLRYQHCAYIQQFAPDVGRIDLGEVPLFTTTDQFGVFNRGIVLGEEILPGLTGTAGHAAPHVEFVDGLFHRHLHADGLRMLQQQLPVGNGQQGSVDVPGDRLDT